MINKYRLHRAKVLGNAQNDSRTSPQDTKNETISRRSGRSAVHKATRRLPVAIAAARMKSPGSDLTFKRNVAQLLAGSSGRSPAHVRQTAKKTKGKQIAIIGCAPAESTMHATTMAPTKPPTMTQVQTKVKISDPALFSRINSEYLPSQRRSNVESRVLIAQNITATRHRYCALNDCGEIADKTTVPTVPITADSNKYPRL
mmetsp:Transcript_15105/g.24663  ORF Transcript_15105/g.24663 Transcript_15105/m.24663 type:complete len:201 (+) Transcript_15105:79-681(+)